MPQILLSAPLQNAQALVVFNRPVFEAYDDIRKIVSDRLGPDFATVFSRPEQVGDHLTWTTELTGPVRPWQSLDAAERGRFDGERVVIGEALAGLASDLIRSGPNTRLGNLGTVLNSALEVPAIEHLHLVGDRPVLTYWGFRDAGRPPLALSASIPPPPPTAGEAPMSARRLPWAWLAILPLLLLFLAVWYFVGLPPGAPPGPPPDAVLPAPLPTPSAAPPAPVAPDERPAIPPQPEPVAPADPSPPPEPAPPPQPAPAPAPVQAGPPPAIDIPKAAWDGHDLRLLEGCWMLGRDVPVVLTSNGPDEPGMEHADRLCFDSSGHGTRKALAIFPSQTITCEAPITTTFSKNGHLHTRQPDVLCTGTTPATKWRARTLDCTRQADGTADCVGVSGAGKAHFLFHRAPD